MRFSLSLLVLIFFGRASYSEAANHLQLLISVGQPAVTAPESLRVTLHFHNAGTKTLWLYQPARPPSTAGPFGDYAADISETGPQPTRGGPTLEVQLRPANPSALETPAQGVALESAGLPHPKLVCLAPGDDTEEKVLIQLVPAAIVTHDGKKKMLWGTYQMSVTYRAEYSNASEIEKNLGADLWHNETVSNTITIELHPSPGKGAITGSVVNSVSQPLGNILISLSDQDEQTIAQERSDTEGRFSFSGLPWGLYWVTARRPAAAQDTAVFRHAVVSQAQPTATVELMLIPSQPYEPKQVLHKPVLLRIDDAEGRPLEGISMEALFSNGSVLDKVKRETGSGGTAALELIPGRNFLTLKKRGCADEERRLDVAQGSGVDAFRFEFVCSRK